MSAGSYHERFAAFAAKSERFRPCSILEPDGGRRGAGTSYKVPMGRVACQCCGNRRLKNFYPVMANGGPIYLIGSECLKALEQAGKLAVEMPWQAPVWKVAA